MSGTVSNTAVWQEFEIYVTTDLAVALPASASAVVPAGWGTPVGLLEGDSALAFAREFGESKPIFDINGNLIRMGRKNFMETVKFTMIEDNAKTRAMIHPGSPAGSIVTPQIVPYMMLFQATDGTKVYRLITANYAEIDVDGGWEWKPGEVFAAPMTATIFPVLATKARWTEQKSPTLVSIALTPLTLALTTGQIKSVVATGTYDDASTVALTDVVTWSSSNTAKATVRFGDVTWVAAGSSNITCSYLGISSTAACVVTCS